MTLIIERQRIVNSDQVTAAPGNRRESQANRKVRDSGVGADAHASVAELAPGPPGCYMKKHACTLLFLLL